MNPPANQQSHMAPQFRLRSHPAPNTSGSSCITRLATVNEQTWLKIASLSEAMLDPEKAIEAYESALRHNPYSIQALTQLATLCRNREQLSKAIDCFQRIIKIEPSNGEAWGALGHCYLTINDLPNAYTAYQQALYFLPNPKDPKLWYGIGILYDRHSSMDHAEEAFSVVLKMDPKFEKANEVYFRLGIIYKHQRRYDLSLQCFRYIVNNPPRPLKEMDIWFQIGHVHDQQKEYDHAKEAYEHVLAENPGHAKALQQLGWLHHQQTVSFSNQDTALSYLTRSLEVDPSDAQSWYLLGRCYMTLQRYGNAHEAYQQAVYRDGNNPAFWCSIGVLYFQLNQYRDALDAYSRAIRLNPNICEVWYDLGALYESCNNQVQDAVDAYRRAAELDPDNMQIKQRLQLLRSVPTTGGHAGIPTPKEVNPVAFDSGSGAGPKNTSAHLVPSNNPPPSSTAGHVPGQQESYPRGPVSSGLPPHPLLEQNVAGDRYDTAHAYGLSKSGPPPEQQPRGAYTPPAASSAEVTRQASARASDTRHYARTQEYVVKPGSLSRPPSRTISPYPQRTYDQNSGHYEQSMRSRSARELMCDAQKPLAPPGQAAADGQNRNALGSAARHTQLQTTGYTHENALRALQYPSQQRARLLEQPNGASAFAAPADTGPSLDARFPNPGSTAAVHQGGGDDNQRLARADEREESDGGGYKEQEAKLGGEAEYNGVEAAETMDDGNEVLPTSDRSEIQISQRETVALHDAAEGLETLARANAEITSKQESGKEEREEEGVVEVEEEVLAGSRAPLQEIDENYDRVDPSADRMDYSSTPPRRELTHQQSGGDFPVEVGARNNAKMAAGEIKAEQ